MKKFLALLLSVLLVVSLAVPAFAEGTTATTADKTTVARGETFTLTLSTTDSFNVNAFGVDLIKEGGEKVFNQSAFEFAKKGKKIDYSFPIEDVYDEGLIRNCTEEAAAWCVDPEMLDEGVEVATLTGNLFCLSLKVKDDAAFGTYSIALILKPEGMDAIVSEAVTITVAVPQHDYAPSSTIKNDDPEGHYYPCTVEGCAEHINKTPHTLSTATCQAKATCSCGYVEGDFAAHSYSEATCSKKATCTVCGTETGELAPHSYSEATCSKKAACIYCGTETGDLAPHSYSEATCTKKAACIYCGTETGELLPHDYKEVKADKFIKTPASCTAAAVYYKSCSVCEAKHESETFNGTELLPHSYSEATCTKKATCSACGDEIGELAPHSYSEATCTKKATCTVCGDETGELKAHDYKEVKDAKFLKDAATCTSGAVYYKSCSVCEAKHESETFVDEASKLPHNVKTWEVKEPATTEKEGEKSGKCEACQTELTVKTAKLTATVKVENNDVTVENIGGTNVSEDAVFEVKEVEEAKAEQIAGIVKEFSETKNSKPIASFDMNMVIREEAENGEAIADADYAFEGKLSVTVPVPSFENYENLKLVAIKEDGTCEVVNYTLAGGKATFEVSGMNVYTFVGTEKVVTPPTTTTAPATTTKTPNTGDGASLMLWFSLIVVSALSLLAVARVYDSKKKTRA